MERSNIAHKISSQKRTSDVLLSENVDFAGLLLSEPILKGLQGSGFERPSPIQLKAIPLGRCGLDLIVQAKSGTGKTCVFSVIALESLELASPALQVLVLAPTREIAVQIQDVVKNIGSCMSQLACHTFIGGLPVREDINKLKKCHIAIGSPGRVKQLIESGLMKTDSIRMFILDEADKLLEESFQEQINWIYSSLPDNKQILALSATYPDYLANHLQAYMRNPTFIRLNVSDPALLGIKQYYTKVPYHPLPNKDLETKTKVVIEILSSVTFKQCLIFSNFQTRAQNLCNDLQVRGWPTSCIAGSLDQKERLAAMNQLKTYQCRVLISTDLTSRGIDADKVDLVINLDVPYDHETYLHRIGRAGRFGSFGAAVSIVSEGREETELKAVERKCNTNILPLPDPLPVDLVKREIQINIDDIITTEKIATESSTTHANVLKNDLNLPEKSAKKSQNVYHSEEDAVKCDDSYKNESSYQNGHFNEMNIGEERSENERYHLKGNRKITQNDSDLSQRESLKEVNKSNNCLVEVDIKSNTGSKTKQVFKKMAARNVHQSLSSSDSASSDEDDDEDEEDDDEQTDAIKPSGQKFIINGALGNENQTSDDTNTGLDGNDGLSKEEMEFPPTARRKGYTKDVSYQKTQKNRNRTSNAGRRNHKDKDSVEIDVFDNEKTEETKPKISEILKSSHEENRADEIGWNKAPGMPMEEAQDGKLRTENVLSDKQRILQSCQDVFSSVHNMNFRIQHPLKDDSKINHGTEQSSRFENSLSLEKEVLDVNCSNNICEDSTDKSPYVPDKKDILKMSSSIQTVNDILKTNSGSQTITVDDIKTNSNIKTVDNILKTNIGIQSVDCADKNILQMSNDVQTVDNILKTSSNSQTVDDHRSSNKGKSVKEIRSGSETKFVDVKPFSDLEIGKNSLEISETSKFDYDVLENSAKVCKSSVNSCEKKLKTGKNSATSSDNAVTSGKPITNLSETSATLSNTSLSSGKPDKTKDATTMHGKLDENTKTHLGENSATLGDTRASLRKSSAKVGDTRNSSRESSAKVGDNRPSSREGSASIGDTKAISNESSAALSETRASSRYTSAALGSNMASSKDTSVALGSNGTSSRDTSAALGEARTSSKGGSATLGETRTRLIETSAALCDTTSNYDIPGDDTTTNSNLTSAKSYNSVKTSESNALSRPQSDEISEINHNQQPGKPNKLKPQQVNYASAVERYKQCQSTEDWKDYDYMAKICEQMKSRSSSLSVELCEDMFKEVDKIYASFGKHKLSFLETNAQGTQTDAIFENMILSANNNHAQSEMKDAEIYEIGKFKCDNSDGAFISQDCDLSDPPFAQSANKHNYFTASDARGKDALDLEESQPFNNPHTLVRKHMKTCSLDALNSEEIRPFTNPPTFVQKQMKRYSVESANKPVDSDLLLRIGRKTIGTKDKNPQSLEMDMDVPESGCPNSSLQDIRPSLAKVSISTQNGVATLSDLEDSSAVCHQEVLPPESDSEILESSSSSCLSSDSDPTPSSDEDADNRSSNLATGYEHCYWNHAYLHHNMQWPYMDKRKKSVRKAHEDYVKSSGHNYPPYMASNKDHAIRYPCYRTRTTSTTSSKHQPKTSKQSETPNKEEGSHSHSKTTNGRTRKYDSSKYGNYAYSYPSSLDTNSYHNWYINHWLPWYQCQPYWQQPSWYPYGLYPYNNHLFRPEMINTADGSVNNMEKLAKMQQDYIRMMTLK